MIRETTPAEPDQVFCAVCLRQVPRSAAAMDEARDYVAYFCGLDCYDKWVDAHSPESVEHEIQSGHDRSRLRDERLKQLARQHPQRDEPRVDSVERNELPAP